MGNNNIDPALDLMRDFARITKGVPRQINEMRQQHIFKDGEVSAKHKTLAAMLWSISSRCEPCIKYYAGQARKLGASESELGEFLAVASTMGGCVGEMWALKAYKAYIDNQANPVQADPSCCP